LKWLQLAFKFYEDLDQQNIARVMALTGIVLKAKGDLKHAESLLRSAVELFKGVRND
jgi:hypothetical protein